MALGHLATEAHWEGSFLIFSHYPGPQCVKVQAQKKKKPSREGKEGRGEENPMTHKASADVLQASCQNQLVYLPLWLWGSQKLFVEFDLNICP